MDPPLAWLYSSTDEAPNHCWSIKTRPLDQVHQLLHLSIVLWSVGPTHSLLWLVPDIIEGGTVEFLADVEPFLIPLWQGSDLGTTKITGFHPISKIEVYSTYNLGSPMGPFLPQIEKITKKIKVRFYPHESLTKMNESSDKEDRVGMQVVDPNLVIQQQALKKWMNRDPETAFQEILKNNNLTGPRVREAFSYGCLLASKFLVV